MKVNVKYRYMEFLSHVEFPALIYYYETNRLVGMNQYAVEILGQNVKSIKELTLNQLRPKLSKELLNNGSKRIHRYTVYTRNGVKTLDFEINSIIVDDRHVCLVLFEYSYKNMFHGNEELLLPRLFWKDKALNYIGMNESFREDIQLPDTILIHEQKIRNEDIFQEDDKDIYSTQERKMLKSKQAIYGKIGMLMVKSNKDLFVKYNSMPIFNKYGTAIGVLGLYHHVVGKDVRRREFYATMENMYQTYEKRIDMMNVCSEIMRLSFLEEESHVTLDRIFNLLQSSFNLLDMRILGCPNEIKIVNQIYQSNQESISRYKHITRSECKLVYRRASKYTKKGKELTFIGTEKIYPLNIVGYEVGIIVFEYKEKLFWSNEMQGIYKDISKIIENILQKERLYEYYNKEVRENK